MTTEEYNKIHAMAWARKLVMQKFGANLLYFWPMADDTVFIHDLLRQKPLIGSGIALRKDGMLDYAVDLQTGYLSDVVPSTGGLAGTVYTQAANIALPLPTGRWISLLFTSDQPSPLTVCVAPANTPYSQVASKALFSVPTTAQQMGFYYHTATFPFVVDNVAGQLWAYVLDNDVHYNTLGTYGISGYYWNGSSWVANANKYEASFDGVGAGVWPSYDKFTVGALVALYNSGGNGAVVAIADATEAKARLFVTSAKKAEGKFKNTNGSLYTVTAPSQLHPGYNLLALFYARNVAVKLGVNGQVVATATPNDFPLFNTTLALGIGVMMKTDKTTQDQLKNALVDDVFLAKGVVSDADLWDIYMAYLTAAPLMQVEGTAKFVLA